MQELYRREEVEGERLMNIRRDPHYLALARPNAAIPVQDFLYPDPDWVEERHLQALRGARQVSQEEDTTLLDKFLKFYLENDVPLLPEFDFEAFRWTLGSHTQEEQTESRYGRSDCEDRQEMLSCFEGFKTVNELVL
ncbi:unnamed protein product [Cyprideis torosa]|uniref:Uncharacterized protein n=1 Tax=Cyprideis torosa TaxID=163714 RepID=A0A7R8W5J1_9CRUS|nr:unnamed protein product [Cyprideis torosa]CAG0885269.1 unnamed protein product [Cyprideis torosa]